VLERALAISRRRALPRIARTSFESWFARRGGGGERAAPRGRAVLFVDTFTNYHHPEIGVAAAELLAACGYRVVPSRHGCCGRPALSKGFVAMARRQARATVERLAPLAEAGLPIIGLEPSCLLTLRDEYFDLLPGDPRVERVAAAAELLEEHLARLVEEGTPAAGHAGDAGGGGRAGGGARDETEAGAGSGGGADGIGLAFAGPPREVLLHGHCHQKALVGTGPSRRVLSLPPGWRVTEVDSGCCGMAGSFGYEAEHVEISLAMAERRLLPAVRAAGPDVLIVAAGTSCRQQILDATDRRALHPAEALRGALAPAPR
jgi:Fe-S oxidoreductase